MTGLNWSWIVLGATAPALAAVALAYPFWRKDQMIFGNVVGSALIFASALSLIFREYAEVDVITQRCLDEGHVCWPDPSAFTRFAIYAAVGLLQIFAVFYVSLKVEEGMRRRLYAPEWRR